MNSPQICEKTLFEEASGEIFAKSGVTKICFVCTGNTCRSPMAAALYNYLTQKKDTYAVSMGLYPVPGDHISDNAVKALESRGIESNPHNPYKEHTARAVCESVLCGCDRIIGMTESHTLELIARFPALALKIYSMPSSVSDPYGKSEEAYRSCLLEIEKGIRELFGIEA